MRHLTLRLSTIPALACCLLASGAMAAEMTDAEKDALRSSCRSDYFSYCSSVPRGPAVLTCLQKNIASVSAGCRQALSNLGGASAPPPAATEAATRRQHPPPRPRLHRRRRAHRPRTPPRLRPLRHRSRLLQPTRRLRHRLLRRRLHQRRRNPTAGSDGHPASSSRPVSQECRAAALAPPPAAAVEPAPVRPLERLVFLRRACGGDARAFCAGVPLGGGRIVECLSAQMPSLSPPCRDALVVLGR